MVSSWGWAEEVREGSKLRINEWMDGTSWSCDCGGAPLTGYRIDAVSE